MIDCFKPAELADLYFAMGIINVSDTELQTPILQRLLRPGIHLSHDKLCKTVWAAAALNQTDDFERIWRIVSSRIQPLVDGNQRQFLSAGDPELRRLYQALAAHGLEKTLDQGLAQILKVAVEAERKAPDSGEFEQDVAAALKEGQLSGFAADVLSTEPPKKDNPLLAAENTLLTPHIAWAGLETRKRLLDILNGNIEAFLNGSPRNIVN